MVIQIRELIILLGQMNRAISIPLEHSSSTHKFHTLHHHHLHNLLLIHTYNPYKMKNNQIILTTEQLVGNNFMSF